MYIVHNNKKNGKAIWYFLLIPEEFKKVNVEGTPLKLILSKSEILNYYSELF